MAAVGLLLLVRRRLTALLAFAAAETATAVSSAALKVLVGRPRPPDGLVHPVGSSYPSGHAAYAAVTCVAAVLLFTEPGAHRRPWWALATVGVVGMAWSRTYLQVHWLSDVVAGAALGSGVAMVTFAVVELVGPRLALPPFRFRR